MMRKWMIYALVVPFCWVGAGVSQTPTISPTERLFLYQLQSGRLSGNEFRRQVYAWQTLRNNEANRKQQESRRQQNAVNRGANDTSRSAGRVRPESRRAQTTDGETDNEELPPQLKEDILLVWERLGGAFRPAAPAAINKAAPKFRTGLILTFVRREGPIDKAGWKEGDVLLGLNGYRTESYEDLAYVAENLSQPADAILLREAVLKKDRLSIEKEGKTEEKPAGKPTAPSSAVRLPKTTQAKDPAKEPAPAKESAKPPAITPEKTEPSVAKIEPKVAKPEPIKPTAPAEPKPVAVEKVEKQPVEPPPAEPKKPETAAKPTTPVKQPPQNAVAEAKPGPAIVNTYTGDPIADPKGATWKILGVKVEPVNVRELNERFESGLKITEIAKDSVAEQAGCKLGDIFVGLDKFQLNTVDDLAFVLSDRSGVATVRLDMRLLRDKEVVSGVLRYLNEPEPPKVQK